MKKDAEKQGSQTYPVDRQTEEKLIFSADFYSFTHKLSDKINLISEILSSHCFPYISVVAFQDEDLTLKKEKRTIDV